jgi:hypothetical protein
MFSSDVSASHLRDTLLEQPPWRTLRAPGGGSPSSVHLRECSLNWKELACIPRAAHLLNLRGLEACHGWEAHGH